MKIYKLIITITIPIFILMLFASILTTKQYLLVSKGLYESHNDITFDHDLASDKIMGYLNYRYDELQYDFEDGSPAFRQIEIDHMEDVKDLYTGLRLVALGSLIIGVSLSIFLYKKDKKEFYSTYKSMYLWPMFFVIFVGGYVLIDFGAAFTAFHGIFFRNDDWQLLTSDTLIQMLPINFWMVSGIIILLSFSGSMVGIYYWATKSLRKIR